MKITPKTTIVEVLTAHPLQHDGYKGRLPGYINTTIDKFCQYLKRPAQVGDLNEQYVEGFEKYISQLISPNRTAQLRTFVLMIWAHLRILAPRVVPIPAYRLTAMTFDMRYPKPDADDPQAAKLLETYFERVYLPRRMLGKSPRTVRMYRMVLCRFSEYLGRRALITDLNDEALCGYITHRLGKGLAAHTVDKERDKLVALANFAARKRAIPEFVDVPPLNPAYSSPQCLRVDQVNALLSAAAASEGNIGDAPAGLFWTALVLAFLYTGERTGAMIVAEWEWLTPDGWLRIPATVRKGGRKAMNYRLPAQAFAAMEKLRPFTLPTGKIFGGYWARGHLSGTFYLHYTKLLDRAGLPNGRKWKPQSLRRTFASFLEAAGGDATRALAHSTRKTTEESYLDETVIDRAPPSALVENLIGSSLKLPKGVA